MTGAVVPGAKITVVNTAMGAAVVMSRQSVDAINAEALRQAAQRERRPVTVRELGRATVAGIETIGYEATDGERVFRAWIAPSRADAATSTSRRETTAAPRRSSVAWRTTSTPGVPRGTR